LRKLTKTYLAFATNEREIKTRKCVRLRELLNSCKQDKPSRGHEKEKE